MEAATLSRTPPRSGPVEVGLIASLLVVAAGAWAETGDRMGGMDAGPGPRCRVQGMCDRTFTTVPLGSRSMKRRTPHSSSRSG
jgi:hypothetical protein